MNEMICKSINFKNHNPKTLGGNGIIVENIHLRKYIRPIYFNR